MSSKVFATHQLHTHSTSAATDEMDFWLLEEYAEGILRKCQKSRSSGSITANTI